MNSSLPILYSFRRCPYAIRARLAIAYSGQQTALREVLLKNKPEAFLTCSPKATVPVLQLASGQVIEESLDIMLWALKRNDPAHWLPSTTDEQCQIDQLINENDLQFKPRLDRYKYASGHPEMTEQEHRVAAEPFLLHLEALLCQHRFLVAERVTLADVAIFPFIRQFAGVDQSWFQQAPYPKLRAWLVDWLGNPLFQAVMEKYPPWKEDDSLTVFPNAGFMNHR
ncbi:MAG: glutathione S-transferase [Sedimenticola sp.]|nr:glutathione S-transferase [Sedimenticola sp.]